jgi:hypothetical protein
MKWKRGATTHITSNLANTTGLKPIADHLAKSSPAYGMGPRV